MTAPIACELRQFSSRVSGLGLGFVRWHRSQALIALGCIAASAQTFAAAPASDILGSWKVTRGVVAPWVKPGRSMPDARAWLGQTVRFDADRATGAGLINCGHARYEATRTPPEGLFQGVLPAPAKTRARALGLPAGAAPGTSLTCDTGIFELHRADATTLLVAVDNVIWTLDRSPGSAAEAGSAAAVVQALLQQHFAADMGFDARSVEAKKAFMSDRLLRLARTYLAKPQSPDEVPDIDSDPWTDSQEYPARFSVGAGKVDGTKATVAVRFADGYQSHTVRYRLVRDASEWRVDDLQLGDGSSLAVLLREAVSR